MTDTASSVTFASITIFGFSTGIQPDLLLAGAAGGWWALSYQETYGVFLRLRRILLSALIAAYAAPLATYWMTHAGIPELVEEMIRLPIALAIGLIAVDILGEGLRNYLSKWLNKKSGGD